jgi:pimeloyl-ACP methyl ester carboxylesterase
MFVEANGVKLFCKQAGGGEPLVLVHGSWADHHSWNAVFEKLAVKYQVLAYDRRGHSRSERPPVWATLNDHVKDLAALLRSFTSRPAHVVASSSGGAIALGLASDRPELVRTLVLHEPPLLKILDGSLPLAPLLRAFWDGCARVRSLVEQGDMSGAARTFLNDLAIGPGAWEALPPKGKAIFIDNAPTFLAEAHDSSALDSLFSKLQQFKGPVLLTEGEQSLPFFRPVLDRLAQVLPQAKRHIFEGASHLPQQELPDEYIRVVNAFLETSAQPLGFL